MACKAAGRSRLDDRQSPPLPASARRRGGLCALSRPISLLISRKNTRYPQGGVRDTGAGWCQEPSSVTSEMCGAQRGVSGSPLKALPLGKHPQGRPTGTRGNRQNANKSLLFGLPEVGQGQKKGNPRDVRILTPRTCARSLIWEKGLCRCDKANQDLEWWSNPGLATWARNPTVSLKEESRETGGRHMWQCNHGGGNWRRKDGSPERNRQTGAPRNILNDLDLSFRTAGESSSVVRSHRCVQMHCSSHGTLSHTHTCTHRILTAPTHLHTHVH